MSNPNYGNFDFLEKCVNAASRLQEVVALTEAPRNTARFNEEALDEIEGRYFTDFFLVSFAAGDAVQGALPSAAEFREFSAGALECIVDGNCDEQGLKAEMLIALANGYAACREEYRIK
jgi:hypothetical protein